MSLKRSEKRVNHAKVCGGGGSRMQRSNSPLPPPPDLTPEDFDRIFDDDISASTIDRSSTTASSSSSSSLSLPRSAPRQQPTRPTPISVLRHGHEVMSPRVARLLREGNVANLNKEAGAAPSVYLPYSSRHPRQFPLRLLSYREYARTGGAGINNDNNADEAGSSKTGRDTLQMTAQKRLELAARRQFKTTYPNHKDDMERRKIGREFYRKLNAAPRRKKRNQNHHGKSGTGRHRKRPPTPGLPRKKTDRPAERLHGVAQKFVTCRTAADNALLLQLDTIERERQMTIERKKRGMTDDSPLQFRPDWTWISEVRSMRLVADVAKLEELIRHAKKHVWYMSMLKEMHDHANDPTKTQLYIIDFIHRILSFGIEFDHNCFVHLLSAINPEEFEAKIIQDMLHMLRLHTHVSLEMYVEWCLQLELGLPDEKKQLDLHLKKQQKAKAIEHAAIMKKMEQQQHKKQMHGTMGTALSALGGD